MKWGEEADCAFCGESIDWTEGVTGDCDSGPFYHTGCAMQEMLEKMLEEWEAKQ